MLAVGLFALAGWFGSSIPRNGDWQPPGSGGVVIMVETNGMHTGIVMPLVNPQKDWRGTFPFTTAARADGEVPTHIAVGWGEREVFLNVPRWADLKPSAALRIATTGGGSVMRINPYVRPAPDADHRPLRITAAQYARLVTQIENTLAPPNADGTRTMLRGSEQGAVYYAARGRYTLRNNCNNWTSNVLAAAGIRTGWWTPFAGGVMKWVADPE